jgi:hypothetical protein
VSQHDIVTTGSKVSPAWTFVTRGLYEFGNKEMVLTLKCTAGEVAEAFKTSGRSFPEAVLHLFANIYDDHFGPSGEGHLDEAMWYEWPAIEGDASQYFLDKAGWSAFILGPPDYLGYSDLEGLFIGKRPYLALQPIFEDEYAIVKRFGAARVMALMGQSLSAYPWPRFVDRDRKTVIPSNVDLAKILSEHKVFDAGEQVLLSDLCAVLSLASKSITVRIPQHQVDLIKKHIDSLAPTQGFIFNLTIAPHADSHLYWNPSPDAKPGELSFMKRPSSAVDDQKDELNLVGGSFLAFMPRGTSDYITVHEDGFIAMISPISWTALRQCLSNGLNCKIASDINTGFELDIGFADDDLPEEEMVEENGEILVTSSAPQAASSSSSDA